MALVTYFEKKVTSDDYYKNLPFSQKYDFTWNDPIRGRLNKKNIESFNLTQKVNF
jgi:hypothetical protein